MAKTEKVLVWQEVLDKITSEDGSVRYYNAAKELHNPAGPAIIDSDGTFYYLNGRHIPEDVHRNNCRGYFDPAQNAFGQYVEHAGQTLLERRLLGTVEYFDNQSRLHNLAGPAVITAKGHQKWYIDGILFSKEAHAATIRGGPIEPVEPPEDASEISPALALALGIPTEVTIAGVTFTVNATMKRKK
jgi:hypothetical protein